MTAILAPMRKQGFWPFGPTDESIASFDTNGCFSGFRGANCEETVELTFGIKEEPAQRLVLPK